MNGQNSTRLTRGLSALIVLASALWSMVPAAPGAPQKLALLLAERAAQATGSGITAVDAGGSYTCAIESGALYCWGLNYTSQLGASSSQTCRIPSILDPYPCSTIPLAVTDMGSGVTAVAAGGGHTCAIKSGALYCWGGNDEGELGDGTTTRRTTPVAVQNMGSGATAVAADGYHTCAIKSGALYCWGWNYEGELGDGTTTKRTTPVAVQNMGSGVTVFAAGGGTPARSSPGRCIAGGRMASASSATVRRRSAPRRSEYFSARSQRPHQQTGLSACRPTPCCAGGRAAAQTTTAIA